MIRLSDDLAKEILEALEASEAFFTNRDLRNAIVHLSPTIRWSPITTKVETVTARFRNEVRNQSKTVSTYNEYLNRYGDGSQIEIDGKAGI